MKKKTKILMYATFNSDEIQAQNRDALHWALYLDASEYKVTAFISKNPDKRLINKKNIKLVALSKNRYIGNIQKIFSLVNPFYDYVLLSTPSNITLFYLRIKKYMPYFGKKVLISLVNRLPYEGTSKEILYYKKFNQFAISQQIQKDFYKLTGEKIEIVHLIYDLKKFHVNDKVKRKNRITCIGSMQIRKNPFLFANIASKFPSFEFTWIGDGYYYDWIKEKIKRKSIKNLTLIRKLDQNMLANYLNESLFFLFPSVHEGFPNVLVEALASGLPVIAMSSYGPEAILDGNNGFVVENEYEMYDKVKELTTNHALLEKMSENARKSAERYEGAKSIDEFERFISLLNKKKTNEIKH